MNDEVMTDEILREQAMLEDIKEATSEDVLFCVCRLEVLRAQRSALMLRKLRNLIPSGKTPKSVHVRPHTVTSANIEGQDIPLTMPCRKEMW